MASLMLIPPLCNLFPPQCTSHRFKGYSQRFSIRSRKNSITCCGYSAAETRSGRCGWSCCSVPLWCSTLPFWYLHTIKPPKVHRRHNNYSRQNKSPGCCICLNGSTVLSGPLPFLCLGLTALFTHSASFIHHTLSAWVCLSECLKQDNNRQVLRGRTAASVDVMLHCSLSDR